MLSPAEKIIEIRASSLPSAADCWRRWAANNASLQPLIHKFGYIIPKHPNNVGATIGTACHEGMGAFFQAKIDGYVGSALTAPSGNPIYAAQNKYRRLASEISDLRVDRETPDTNTAVKQIERMLSIYIPFAETLEPKRAEFKLETRLDPIKPYIVSGHPDLFTIDGSIRDMKFGKNLSPYEAQLGTYRLMARSYGMETSHLFVDWIKRVSLKSEQPPLQVVEYNTATAENAAHHTIEESVRQIEKFSESGNAWSFQANPNSKLCSKKWCPAWGTDFCDLGRPEKEPTE